MIDYHVWRLRLNEALRRLLKLPHDQVDLLLRKHARSLRNDYEAGMKPRSAAESLLPLLREEIA